MAKPKEKTKIEVLVEEIRIEEALLDEKAELLSEAKNEHKNVLDSLKTHKEDANILYKYASESEKELLETLRTDSPSTHSRNDIAQTALEIMEANKELRNEDLYSKYIDSVPKNVSAATYTEFNIKIRTLFSSKLLTRVKDENSNSSREDIISFVTTE